MKEIWKDIPENPLYQVSNLGRIRSWNNNRWGKSHKPKIVKQSDNAYGYKVVNIGMGNTRRVNRLVAEAFVDNPKGKPSALHKNDVKHDNMAENLYWGDKRDNMRDRRKNSHMNEGENHGMSKLTRNDVLDIRNAYRLGCFTQREIADAYSMNSASISDIINNKAWKHV